MVSNISMNDFLNLKGNINIIDIRSRERYNSNHIPNSINIESEKLIVSPSTYLDKNTRYYIYCQRGTSSYKVCSILSNLGYKVTNINGGYESFILHQ
ncbi:MAG: rhodanese-like domain-containing protein [Bacilli bacterium]|nr:rhodanese-like domain-containing protein [Bacilli bacterium]